MTAANVKLEGVYPARFAKQVVFMLLAINGSEFGDKQPDLRRYVVEREVVGLPSRYRLYLSLFDGEVARFGGAYAPIRFKPDGGVEHFVATDLLHPPFAYTLTINQPSDDTGLEVDITWFTTLGIDDRRDMELRIPYNIVLLPPEDMRGISLPQ